MQADTLEKSLIDPSSSSSSIINCKNNNNNDLLDDIKSEKRSRLSSKDSNFTTSTLTSINTKKHIRNATKEKKKYSCNICSKNFIGISDLGRHLLVHSGERPFKCETCHKKFRQQISLRNHIACIHDKECKFSCEYCDKTFPIKERLKLHLRKHTGEKPYSCSFCSKKFARGGQLKQHLPSHANDKKHTCKECKASFINKTNLYNHRKKMHYKEFIPKSENKIKSTASATLITDVKATTMKVSSDKCAIKANTCRVCTKEFKTAEGLKKHSYSCHKHIKQFYCKVCNKTLRGHLQQHLNIHDNIKLYGCSKCNMKFSQKSQLNVHERVHTGERPFMCKVCGQSFSHSYVLKTHYRKHTGEKPFKCPICVKYVAFAQLPHLKTHLRTIHGSDKPYVCEGCNEFFRMKNDLYQHLEKCSKLKSLQSSSSNDKINSDNIGNSSLLNQTILTDLRLNIVIILNKISSKERLIKLGVEKRLIDNVILTALKHAGRKYYDDTTKELNEVTKLKMNVEEFLEWTLPKSIMEQFKKQYKSIEEIIEQLAATGSYKNKDKIKINNLNDSSDDGGNNDKLSEKMCDDHGENDDDDKESDDDYDSNKN